MTEISARTPMAGLTLRQIGTVTLSELVLPELRSVMPAKGRAADVARALEAVGLGLPDPGQSMTLGQARIFWTGRNQYFLAGQDAPDCPAAITDQSDAWAGIALSGAGRFDVLARLCPVDLAAEKPGASLRSQIGHMPAIILIGTQQVELLVFRAFAETLLHETSQAAELVAARAEIPVD